MPSLRSGVHERLPVDASGDFKTEAGETILVFPYPKSGSSLGAVLMRPLESTISLNSPTELERFIALLRETASEAFGKSDD